MRESLQLTGPFEVLQAGAGAGQSLPTFRIMAYDGGEMPVEGFPLPVVVDLAGCRPAADQIPVLYAHDKNQPLGMGRITISASAIEVSGMFTGDDEQSRRVVTHARNGYRWQASIGCYVTKKETLPPGKSAIVNGQQVIGPKVIARESVIFETSILSCGADYDSTVTIAASLKSGVSGMDFEQWLTGLGFDLASLSEEQKNALLVSFHQTGGSQTVSASSPAFARAVQRFASESRIKNIARICDSHPEIGEKALLESWTEDQCELEVLRASRGAPAAHIAGGSSITGEVMECALALNHGLNEKVAATRYSERVIDQSTSVPMRKVTMRTIMAANLRAVGRHAPDGRWGDEDIREAFRAGESLRGQELRASAFSTVSLPIATSNMANLFMVQGFQTVNTHWQKIAQKKALDNFKPHKFLRLTASEGGGAVYRFGLAATGNIPHGDLKESAYQLQADTYGYMLTLTRKDIIDDSAGLLNDVVRQMGRTAIIAIERAMMQLVASAEHEGFFSANHRNLRTGTDSVLGVDSLSAAMELLENQVDDDGEPCLVTPQTLLHPTNYSALAKQLITSMEIRDTSSVEKAATGNPHKGSLDRAGSPFLSASAIQHSSDKAWYLVGNPNDVPAFLIGFLNGQESPMIESAEPDFNKLGISYRIIHDWGVGYGDFRGAVKAKGEAN